MNIIDISWPITDGMTEYKDRKTVYITTIKSFAQDQVRESTLTLHTHTGTHIDAPAHFLHDGNTIDQISLSHYIGTCSVVDFTTVDQAITAEELKKITIEPEAIVLFKTKNSRLKTDKPFDPNFVYLDASAATLLVEKKVKSVGIDYLGIERNQPTHITHKILLQNNIGIIEGLRLEHVQPGSYFLCCLPIALVGLDAAPARAVLLESLSFF